MAELLEVLQLAHEHGVAEVEVGGGGVEAGFDAQGDAGFARLFESGCSASGAEAAAGGMISAAPLVMRSSWSATGGNVVWDSVGMGQIKV